MDMTHLEIPIRGRKIYYNVEVSKHLLHARTDYQVIDIYETETLGKVLTLDGHVQLSTLDEHAYHESLVQIPMLSIASPKRALAVGGGDGGVIRELCKHKSLQHIDLVEIDKGVIEACREHLSEVSCGAFDDVRVNVHIADAFEFIKHVREPYDIIVMDSTDIYEEEFGGLSQALFTKAFYDDCRIALSSNGFLVTQADNHVFCPYSLEAILDTFGEVFPATGAYQALVPSFGGYSAFAWASCEDAISPVWPEARAKKVHLGYLNEATYGLAFSMLRF